MNSDKINFAEKYGYKARDKFKESYSQNKITAVKQALKQILIDLQKSLTKYHQYDIL
ncbi:exported protein A EppA [Borreliella carolinensis]|uniref:Exported protein A EppA n=1 Tax=Borreliella carolinensis TaxID=478174 RepID=A0ACD5GL76_9SPIR